MVIQVLNSKSFCVCFEIQSPSFEFKVFLLLFLCMVLLAVRMVADVTETRNVIPSLDTRSKSADVDNFFIDTSNGPLTEKDSVKNLGVIFDQKLSWEAHVQCVVTKLYITRGILSKLRSYTPVSVSNLFFSKSNEI